MAQAALVASAFSLLLAGSNIVNPLLPLYRGQLGFDPFLLSLTFVAYVTVLTIVLLAFSRPAMARWSPWALCAAVLLAAMSDILLALGTEPSIMLGRAVAGLAGGAGTGAASSLLAAAIGTAGRSLTATGNLVGAVGGTLFSQLCIELVGLRAIGTVPAVHAAVCGVVGSALMGVLISRRRENRTALASRIRGERFSLRLLHGRLPSIGVGSVAWIAISTSVVLVPSSFGDRDMDLVQAAGALVLLTCSAASQLLSPWLARRVPWLAGAEVLAVGAALQLLGGGVQSIPIALVGFALVGVGAGIGYRVALVVVTRGSSPAQQGALASLFAAVTYAAAASAALLTGAVGNLVGLVPAAAVVLGVVTVSSLALVRRSPRLRDSVGPRPVPYPATYVAFSTATPRGDVISHASRPPAGREAE